MRLGLALLLWSVALVGETRYEIDLAETASHILIVTIETECRQADCEFQMPVWNATYQIRDFAQYVMGLGASGARGPLEHGLVTPSRWRVQASPGERVRVRYQYWANNPGPFGCSASSRHVFLNFAQILMYPVDRLHEPMTVRFRSVPAGWKIALELAEQGGAFRARRYDELVDAPAELSQFAEASFLVGGKRLRVVVDSDTDDYDLSLLENTARKIAATATDIMQDVPFPSYTFIYHFRQRGSGGMEHANSTAIDSRAPCRECTLAHVTAHEFFHLWNVKRIRPQSLEPIDYTRENITPSLWFSEGVTSTYASYILLEAGLDSPAEFLGRLGARITRYEQSRARLAQSAEESSIAAWLERYTAYRRPARSISYYLKGELAGYLLDLSIRHFSGGRRSLDDVMRKLNTEYAQKSKWFEDATALERLASEAAGRDMKPFFDAIIRRPAAVEWSTYLGYAGYKLDSAITAAPSLRLETTRAPGQGVTIAEVESGGAGEKAGVRAGDRVLSVNNRVVERSLEGTLETLGLKPGSRVSIEIERGGRPRTITATVEATQRMVYRVSEKAQVTGAERAVRAGWLRSGTKP